MNNQKEARWNDYGEGGVCPHCGSVGFFGAEMGAFIYPIDHKGDWKDVNNWQCHHCFGWKDQIAEQTMCNTNPQDLQTAIDTQSDRRDLFIQSRAQADFNAALKVSEQESDRVNRAVAAPSPGADLLNKQS